MIRSGSVGVTRAWMRGPPTGQLWRLFVQIAWQRVRACGRPLATRHQGSRQNTSTQTRNGGGAYSNTCHTRRPSRTRAPPAVASPTRDLTQRSPPTPRSRHRQLAPLLSRGQCGLSLEQLGRRARRCTLLHRALGRVVSRRLAQNKAPKTRERARKRERERERARAR